MSALPTGIFRIVACSVFALTALVYWPGLNGPLILDDVVNLQLLRRLDAQHALTLGNILSERGALLDARPVSWWTFLLNWEITGDDIWALKLTNLVVHLTNGALVYLLASSLTRLAGNGDGPGPRLVALGCAAFWLLTPVHVTGVLYVIQRMTLLSALFVLLGLLLWCQGRLRQVDSPRLASALMLGSVLVCWPLATLSKQNGALLIWLILATEWMLLAPGHLQGRPRWPVRLALLSSAALLLAGLVRAIVDPSWVLQDYAVRDFTLGERLLTQPRVLLHYALNVLQLPGGTPLGLFHDDFVVSRGFLEPATTLPALLLWIGLVVLAWRARGTRLALAAYGVVFFVVASLLEAGPFPLELYFEHRSYLPAAGIAIALAWLVARLAAHTTRPALLVVGIVAVVSAHAVITATRAVVWTSWEGIIEANARSHPRSVRARAGIAILAIRDGRLDDGLRALSEVSRLGGDRVRAGVAFKRLVAYCLSDRAPTAADTAALQALPGLEDSPYTVSALRWYREVLTSRPCAGQDLAIIARVVSRHVLRVSGNGLRRGNWILHDEAARLLEAAGARRAARDHLRAAVERAPPSVKHRLLERLAGS